jgi:uncharacterized membrane protein YdbT with pleckstrin-like domain
METEYPSRVDSWIAVGLVGVPLLVVVLGLSVLEQSIAGGTAVVVIGVLIGGMIAGLTIPCAYTLNDDMLRIKAGVMEDEVPLQKITGVAKSSSIWTAPALSLKRVSVSLVDGHRVISPRDRDAFIADLEARLHRSRASRTAAQSQTRGRQR